MHEPHLLLAETCRRLARPSRRPPRRRSIGSSPRRVDQTSRPAYNFSVINVTPQAATQVIKMMAEQGLEGGCLRVSVKPSGCSGLEYVMDFAPQPGPGDRVTEIDGLKVVVDAASAVYL